jgi:hypothetical protein
MKASSFAVQSRIAAAVKLAADLVAVDSVETQNYCNFAYSALACFRMGMSGSGSASFQRAKIGVYSWQDFACLALEETFPCPAEAIKVSRCDRDYVAYLFARTHR